VGHPLPAFAFVCVVECNYVKLAGSLAGRRRGTFWAARPSSQEHVFVLTAFSGWVLLGGRQYLRLSHLLSITFNAKSPASGLTTRWNTIIPSS